MAGTKFAYVRNFELPDPVLPNTFMLVRIDGKGFHKFSEAHHFTKPNDPDALELMNECARHVMQQLKGEIILAFGESDEYSFLFHRSCTLYNRRNSKIVTHVVSLFTGAYIFHWSKYFPNNPLKHPPSFDGRLVPYPSVKEVRDYFSWRQADTHINNLYNTTFWALVLQGGQSEREAHETLRGTISSQKNEILFSRFNINYEKLPSIYRKGTTIVWQQISSPTSNQDALEESTPVGLQATANQQSEDTQNSSKLSKSKRKALEKSIKKNQRKVLRTLHVDIIGDAFWNLQDSGCKSSILEGGNVERIENDHNDLDLDPAIDGEEKRKASSSSRRRYQDFDTHDRDFVNHEALQPTSPFFHLKLRPIHHDCSDPYIYCLDCRKEMIPFYQPPLRC